jgi:hypothetical protein
VKRSATILAACVIAACATTETAILPGVSSREAYALTPVEEQALRRIALDGSARAAWRLVLFHGTRRGMQQSDVEYWTQVAVENGAGPQIQYSLATQLLATQSGKQSAERRRRGCFWLRRVAAAGLDVGSEIRNYKCPEPTEEGEWARLMKGMWSQ